MKSQGTAREAEGALPERIHSGRGCRVLLSFCPHNMLQGRILTKILHLHTYWSAYMLVPIFLHVMSH